MKTTTEHIAIGTRVWWVDMTNDGYYRYFNEEIKEVGVTSDGITYYVEDCDVSERQVFLTEEEAEAYIIKKLRENIGPRSDN